jgi:hypothetical protein
MKHTDILLLSAGPIAGINDPGTEHKEYPAASPHQTQQAQPPTIASTLDRGISNVRKGNCGSCRSHAGK